VDTPSLTIANVVESDSGYYICEAINPLGTGSSNVVYLDVVGGNCVDRDVRVRMNIQWNLSNPTHQGTREMCRIAQVALYQF